MWFKDQIIQSFHQRRWGTLIAYSILTGVLIVGWALLQDRVIRMANDKIDEGMPVMINTILEFVASDNFPIIAWVIICILVILGFVILYKRTGVGDLSIKDKRRIINLETLTKYLDQRYRTILRPDQPPYQPFYSDRFDSLLKELNEAGYLTIGQLNQALENSEDAYIQWRQAKVGPGESGHPDQIGIATISLQIYDCNFYCIRTGHKPGADEEWLNKYKRFHSLIESGPIPCHSK